MVNIEKELKYILDRQSFRRLYGFLCKQKKPDFIVRQVNYYFDTKTFSIQNKGISVRVRIWADNAELTCKIAAIDEKKAKDFMHSYEYTKQITIMDAKNLLKNGISINIISNLIKPHSIDISHDPSPLICHGRLRTARIGFTIENGLDPLLLDINAYLDTFDYELEWETADIDRARTKLQDLFNCSEVNLPSHTKLKTKRKRYFERKSSLNLR